MSESMALEELVLEFIEDQFRWAILVGVDLVEDDIYLFLDLLLGELGMEDQIGQQLEGPAEMLFHEDGVDKGLLLRSVGVQLTAYVFHTVQDMPGFPLGRTFEDHVLYEMCQAKLILILVSRTDVDGETAIGDWRVDRVMYDPKAIRQCMNEIIHFFFFFMYQPAKVQKTFGKNMYVFFLRYFHLFVRLEKIPTFV